MFLSDLFLGTLFSCPFNSSPPQVVMAMITNFCNIYIYRQFLESASYYLQPWDFFYQLSLSISKYCDLYLGRLTVKIVAKSVGKHIRRMSFDTMLKNRNNRVLNLFFYIHRFKKKPLT